MVDKLRWNTFILLLELIFRPNGPFQSRRWVIRRVEGRVWGWVEYAVWMSCSLQPRKSFACFFKCLCGPDYFQPEVRSCFLVYSGQHRLSHNSALVWVYLHVEWHAHWSYTAPRASQEWWQDIPEMGQRLWRLALPYTANKKQTKKNKRFLVFTKFDLNKSFLETRPCSGVDFTIIRLSQWKILMVEYKPNLGKICGYCSELFSMCSIFCWTF